jgi:hypothetical protein
MSLRSDLPALCGDARRVSNRGVLIWDIVSFPLKALVCRLQIQHSFNEIVYEGHGCGCGGGWVRRCDFVLFCCSEPVLVEAVRCKYSTYK